MPYTSYRHTQDKPALVSAIIFRRWGEDAEHFEDARASTTTAVQHLYVSNQYNTFFLVDEHFFVETNLRTFQPSPMPSNIIFSTA